MQNVEHNTKQTIARIVGLSLLATIAVGIFTAIFAFQGLDVNISADVTGTAETMLQAETHLRAKAYFGLLIFALEATIGVGLYLLLNKSGPFLAGWSLFASLGAAIITLMGAIFAMNGAHIASNEAYKAFTDENGRLMLSSLQATSDYTSFHLGLIVSSAANAGFFYLFLKSGKLPKLISAWGLFVSLFVAIVILTRDFVPALGNDRLTAAFMVSNLIALISTGLYLAVKGVRPKG